MDKDRIISSIPFVNLHGHSTIGSPFDALGMPDAHLEEAYRLGNSGMALSDHGCGNGLSHLILHGKKMVDEGRPIKVIQGVEAYYTPSIEQWKLDYDRIKEANKNNKKLSKQIQSDETGIVIEDEASSKRADKNILNHRRHLVVLATNQEGVFNLYQLVSKSFRGDNYYRFPRIDLQDLKQHNEGLIVSSACLGGAFGKVFFELREKGETAVYEAMKKTASDFINIFGLDRFYGELQWNAKVEQHQLNQLIIRLSKEFGFKLITTVDSHYVTKDQWKDRELYKKLGFLSNKNKDASFYFLPSSIDDVGYELYQKNGDMVWESYKRFSNQCGFIYDDNLILESIERTHDITLNQITDFVPDTTVRLPNFVVPDGKTATQALTQLCLDALKKTEHYKDKVYVDRLRHELNVINRRGFAKYFLTMKAISDKAQEKYLVGTARGSAGGVLISYLLGITQVDPVKYKLQFERFMLDEDIKDGQGGLGYPDIDFDVGKPMELKEYLMKEWGEDSVVPITNFNTLKTKSLIKDIAKFYQIPFEEVNTVTMKMFTEATPQAKIDNDIKSGAYEPTFDETKKHSPTFQQFLNKYPQIEGHIKNLLKQASAWSRHAGGVLVSENLNKYLPLIKNNGVTQSPWPEGQTTRNLEPMGIIKFDLLGLETLIVITNCIALILKKQGNINPSFKDIRKYYRDNLHPDIINLDDQKVYETVFHSGNFMGIFQFDSDSDGVREFCKQAKPKSITDLSNITAIYRPGPLAVNADKTYLENSEDKDNIKYIHPLIKEVLGDTYNVLIYQEQVSALANQLGEGISLNDGNKLRKLLTKSLKDATNDRTKWLEIEKKLEKPKNKFINGCLKHGMTIEQANELFESMQRFAGYSFNFSHSIGYVMISYICAWLSTYYPVEWMCALLDVEDEDKREKAVAKIKQLGYTVKYPEVNGSTDVWQPTEDNKGLIQPLTSIKGFGDKAYEQLVKNRPYTKIEDLLFNENIIYSKLNKKALDVLVRSQALNSLMDERFTGLKHFWCCVAVDRPKTLKQFQENIETYKPEGDFSQDEKYEFIRSLLGIAPTDHLFNPLVVSKLKERFIPPIGEFDKDLELCWFVPREIIEKKTSKGKPYWVLKVTDITSALTEVKIWFMIPSKDKIHMNRMYVAKVQKNDWGFSLKNIRNDLRLVG